LRLRLEAMEHDLATLRSRADDSDQRVAAVAQDLRGTREALQALIQTLPGPGGAATGTPVSPSGVGSSPTGTTPPTPAGATPAAAGIPVPAAGQASAGAVSLENLYHQGYGDYSRGNYALALQELQEFLRRYPDSELGDDAQYLIGEVAFSQQQYEQAVQAFDQVVQNYPQGDKVPAAYLKKGLALLELNRTADAVIQLQHVITAYPRSEEARVARDRLRDLGLRER
jgi:tol-pal system protein YbgF